jgi:Tol biopolymer transport system component
VVRRLHVAAVGFSLLLWCASVSSAGAAFPGVNGVISYRIPDQMADLAYQSFLVPDGSPVPDWLERWDGDDRVERFSPDLAKAAAGMMGPGYSGLAVATAPSRRFRLLTHYRGYDKSDSDPEWSPDSQHLVFDHFRRGHDSIQTIGVDGSGRTRLARGELPAWSSLGIIAFEREEADRRTGVYTINASGGPVQRIATGHDADWSPDGRTVAFDRHGDIFTVPAEGGPAHRVTSGPSWDLNPAFSPDGTQLVFLRASSKFEVLSLADGTTKTFPCPDWACYDVDWLPAMAAPSKR